MHLLRIEPKPGGVRLHDGDATHEALTAFPLFLYLLCESPNLIVIVPVLNGGTRGGPAFSLPLFGGIDLTIEPVLVQSRRADAERGGNTANVQRVFFGWMRLRHRQMVTQSPLQIFT